MKPKKEEGEPAEEAVSDDETTEEEFLESYDDDDEVVECAECGSACPEEKRLVKEIEGESYTFCSKHCAEEYEESLGSTEE